MKNSLWIIWKNPRKRFWLIAIALHLLFLGYQLSQSQFYLADSREYLLAAENLHTHGSLYCGEWPPGRIDYFSKRPPLYPLVLYVFVLPFGSPILLILFQNLLSLFNLFVLTRLLKKHQVDSYGNAFSFFLLLYPAQMIYANFVMTEIWLQSLILGMLWFLWKYMDKPTNRDLLLYSLLLVLAILMKPVMYLFAGVNIVLMGWFFLRKKRSMSLVSVAIIPLLVVMMVGFWNKERTGVFHFSSIQQINLLQYNAYYSLVHSEGTETAELQINVITDRADSMTSYPERHAFIQSAATEILRSHLGAYLGLHIKGVFNFFIDPGRFDLYSFLGIEKREGKGKGLLYHYSESGYRGIFTYLGQQPLMLLFWLLLIAIGNGLKLLAALRFAFLKSVLLEKRLLLLLFVGYLAGITGPLGASRFGVPLFPLMLLMLAFSLQQSWPRVQAALDRLSKGRKKHSPAAGPADEAHHLPTSG